MPVIQPTYKNLESVQATQPVTAWLIHAAKFRRTLSYGEAKRRLERDHGFGTIFSILMGRVAGAAMDRILVHNPNTPLLNILIVQSSTRLPGSGVVGYLATRYPHKRWLRSQNAHKDHRWRDLIEQEAGRVYGFERWDDLYRQVYDTPLPAQEDDLAGTERDGSRYGGNGEGRNHRVLRLRIRNEPSLVRRGLRPEDTETEVTLLSGDRVDVVSFSKDGTVAIEVKSRDSNRNDLIRGVYQCVKYRAVMAAQDIRSNAKVESWLVTEQPLPNDLKQRAHVLDVRTRVITPE